VAPYFPKEFYESHARTALPRNFCFPASRILFHLCSGRAPATTSQQAVAYAHAAEADPLGPQADQQRKAAMAYAENDHTSHVSLCQTVFNQMNSDKSNHGHDISIQMLISTAAFLYEHPEAASDSRSQNVAGLNSALNVYEKFLAADPKTKYSFYDNLLKKRAEGKLEKEVAGMCPK
jgi:hypothetical protein